MRHLTDRPRACAVAERLWSHKSVNSSHAAQSRLEQQCCRMLRYVFAPMLLENASVKYGICTVQCTTKFVKKEIENVRLSIYSFRSCVYKVIYELI